MVKWRLAIYAVLLLVDCTMVAGVRLAAERVDGVAVRWADGYLGVLLVLFWIVGARTRAYSPDALRYPREGTIRVAVAAALAILGAVVLSLLLGRADMIPARLLGETLTTVCLLMLARRLSVAALVRPGRPVTNELVLVDGRPTQAYPGRTVVVAQEVGLDAVNPEPDILDRLGNLLRNCDRVAIDAPPEKRAHWRQALRGIDVEVELVARELDAYGPFELRALEGHCTMLIHRGGLSPSRRVRKRLFDIGLASVALVLLAPLMAVFAIAIVVDSPGPVIFRQRRVGRGNRQFDILKFRSMCANAGDSLGRRSTDRRDHRVTRVGNFLRKTSIDELPQLFNVLAGDMSLVGPRPHPLGSLAGGSLFWQIDAGYWDRHSVKPGMTGLAQVRGLRGATSTANDLTLRLRSDIEYIANWSLLSDVGIVLRTIRVLVHRNAF